MVVYGIKNCNTVKKGVEWLRAKKIDFDFHDYKVKGISEAKLKSWCKQVGWETLVNKRGTTWRQLPEPVHASIVDESSAIKLMLEKTSVIKRPLIERGDTVVVVGFNEEEYEKYFK